MRGALPGVPGHGFGSGSPHGAPARGRYGRDAAAPFSLVGLAKSVGINLHLICIIGRRSLFTES